MSYNVLPTHRFPATNEKGNFLITISQTPDHLWQKNMIYATQKHLL